MSRGDNAPQQDHNPAEAEELSNTTVLRSAAPKHRSHCRDQTLSSKTVLQQGQGGTTRAEDHSSSGQASPRARRLNCGPGTQSFLQPNFSLPTESPIWLTNQGSSHNAPLNVRPTTAPKKKEKKKKKKTGSAGRQQSTNIDHARRQEHSTRSPG